MRLVTVLLLLVHLLSATLYAQASSPTNRRKVNTRQSPSGSYEVAVKSPPRLVVGETYYVTATILNMRSRPVAEGPGDPNLQLGRNAQLTILEISNSNWVSVRYTSEDVSVVGYVSKWYLSDKKT